MSTADTCRTELETFKDESAKIMSLVTAAPHIDDGLFDRLRSATLGRYDLYAELGRGGMAAVYLALDVALGRKVAIKAMLPEIAADAGAVERFRREARFAAAMSHPNIIPIYTVGESSDPPYFVMKYVDGRALDSVVHSEGAQSPAFVHAVLQQVGSALDYAHRRDITHRDIKPANIMLDNDGWILLADFGIAKTSEAQALTSAGMIVGTPAYMSPEHFNGGQVGPAADQYALGCVAYELLTGQRPFQRHSIAEVMKAHLLDEPPQLDQLVPDSPHGLNECIHRMIAKSPADRFATLADAVHAIGVAAPEQQRMVTTHIVKLAKSGAELRPRISQPISPVPPSAVRRRPNRESIQEDIRDRNRSRRWLFGASATVAAFALAGWLWRRDRATNQMNLPSVGQNLVPRVASIDPVNTDTTREPATTRSKEDSAQSKRRIEARVPKVARPNASERTPVSKAAIPVDTPAILTQSDTLPRLLPAKPVSNIAYIKIGSHIAGATLYVDDNYHSAIYGRPKWQAIAPGEHKISVALEGCVSFETTVTVAAGDSLPALNYRDPKCPSK